MSVNRNSKLDVKVITNKQVKAPSIVNINPPSNFTFQSKYEKNPMI